MLRLGGTSFFFLRKKIVIKSKNTSVRRFSVEKKVIPVEWHERWHQRRINALHINHLKLPSFQDSFYAWSLFQYFVGLERDEGSALARKKNTRRINRAKYPNISLVRIYDFTRDRTCAAPPFRYFLFLHEEKSFLM